VFTFWSLCSGTVCPEVNVDPWANELCKLRKRHEVCRKHGLDGNISLMLLFLIVGLVQKYSMLHYYSEA
jgi:hypothetical protein